MLGWIQVAVIRKAGSVLFPMRGGERAATIELSGLAIRAQFLEEVGGCRAQNGFLLDNSWR
jgi:hypothetical protein